MFVVFETTNAHPNKVVHMCMSLGVPKAVFRKRGTTAVQMPQPVDAQDAVWVFSRYSDMVKEHLGTSCTWHVSDNLKPGFTKIQLTTTKAEA